ncbi:MAG TPA: saccharopine dehydrogenase C-terminal domain-containing protein [Arachidicoccus sp.]|nr:saccharopine dehydrogenase C-terminal domain-containing protein [Arachidicoccus sp.]
MTKAIIIGGGKIGSAAAYLLHLHGNYEVTLADANPILLEPAAADGLTTLVLDVKDEKALRQALEPQALVLSACPYFLNLAIAEAAAIAGTHYFDLTEDVNTTAAIRGIAHGAAVSFMPQCGLAPGFISIAANDLTRQFDSLDSVKLRVGALPQFPTNSLKYNLTWSTDGLINEYCNPCDAIVGGQRVRVMPLEGYERFSLEGIEYEAFNTSGGLSALAEVLEGKVRELDYKTARYPGHRDLMKFLLTDMGFAHKKEALKALLDEQLPFSPQDKVLVFIAVTGKIKGRFMEKIFTRTIRNQEIGGKDFTAIQVTTAGAACAVIDLHVQGKLPGKGFVRQEDVHLKDLMESEFARFYV